jgi:hypothetical protein
VDTLVFERDANTLRQRSVPEQRIGEIIVGHVNFIASHLAEQPFVWEAGELHPRARYITDYTNALCRRNYRHRDIVVGQEVNELFLSYLTDPYAQQMMGQRLSAIGRATTLTAASCLWFVTYKMQGDCGQLQDYRCQPIVTSHEATT